MGFAQVSTLVHWMSHSVAVHAIGPVHAPVARHPSLHLLPAHRIAFVHEPAPWQVIVHELAETQSICPVHVPSPTQSTTHGMPVGQTMGFVQVPAPVHVTVQVPAGSHVPLPGHAVAISRHAEKRAKVEQACGQYCPLADHTLHDLREVPENQACSSSPSDQLRDAAPLPD